MNIIAILIVVAITILGTRLKRHHLLRIPFRQALLELLILAAVITGGTFVVTDEVWTFPAMLAYIYIGLLCVEVRLDVRRNSKQKDADGSQNDRADEP